MLSNASSCTGRQFYRLQILLFTIASALAGLAAACGEMFLPQARQQISLALNMLGFLTFLCYLADHPGPVGKKLLWIGCGACSLFLLLKFLSSGLFAPLIPGETRFADYSYCYDYLIFLPFAAFAAREDPLAGFRILGSFVIGAALIHCVFDILLCFGLLKPPFTEWFYWRGYRLNSLWNPNLIAGIFMNALFFLLIFLCTARRKWARIGCLLSFILIFFFLSLTQTRNVTIMTSVMLGGISAFLIFGERHCDKPVKHWALLIAAGLVIAVILIFVFHYLFVLCRNTFIAAAVQASPEELAKNYAFRNSLKCVTSFGFRTEAWKLSLNKTLSSPRILLLGYPELRTFWEENLYFHSMNSWLETFMSTGILGLILALFLTALAVKYAFTLIFFRKSTMVQKIVSIYVCCLLVTQMLESFLFAPPYPRNYINIVFLLCLGYLACWVRQDPSQD